MPEETGDKRWKISILIWGLQGGAFTNLGTSLARGLLAHGADVELLVLKTPTADECNRYAGIKITKLGAERASLSLRALIRHLRRERPDVLLSMPAYLNLTAILAVRLARAGTRSIISEHNNLSFDQLNAYSRWSKMRLLPWIMKIMYPFAHGLIAPSSGILADPLFQECIRYCRYPTAVIPNPVPWELAALRKSKVITPMHPWLAPDREVPVLLSSGRLVKQKGFDTLLRAIKELDLQGIAARLLVLGDGPLRADLLQLREELSIQDRVEFLGFTHNALHYMAQCDAFVLASRWEGFGIVLAEAMACGKPIVATNAPGGPQEFLEDRQNALMVPVDDVPALALALIEILKNEELSQKVSAEASRRFSDYMPATVAGHYLDFFKTAA